MGRMLKKQKINGRLILGTSTCCTSKEKKIRGADGFPKPCEGEARKGGQEEQVAQEMNLKIFVKWWVQIRGTSAFHRQFHRDRRSQPTLWIMFAETTFCSTPTGPMQLLRSHGASSKHTNALSSIDTKRLATHEPEIQPFSMPELDQHSQEAN